MRKEGTMNHLTNQYVMLHDEKTLYRLPGVYRCLQSA